MNTSEYLSIIENIKSEIKAAQYRAAVHANVDMLLLYHDIGCVINEHKSWGNKFIDNLANEILLFKMASVILFPVLITVSTVDRSSSNSSRYLLICAKSPSFA